VALLSFAAGVLVTRWWSGDDAVRRTTRHEQGAHADSEALVEARAEIERLRADRAPAEPPEGDDPGETHPSRGEGATDPESSGDARRFEDALTREKIGTLEWRAAGAAMQRLMPLLAEANEVAYERAALRPELWGEILESAGPVISIAVRVETAGVSWSYPTVQLNLLAATLASANEPLTEAQFDGLDSIGRAFVEADARRREAYRDEVSALRKRVDKSRLLGDLFAAAEPLLTNAQRAVLWPTGVRGVIGLDLFSAASGWDEHVRHLPHAGRESLRKAVTDGLMAHLALPPEQRGLVEHWATEWAAAFPDAYLLAKPGKPERANVDMTATARVLAAAEAQVRLYDSLMAHVPMSASARKKLLDLDIAFVPIRTE